MKSYLPTVVAGVLAFLVIYYVPLPLEIFGKIITALAIFAVVYWVFRQFGYGEDEEG